MTEAAVVAPGRLTRLAVFTANPKIRESPFWPAIISTPGVREILLVSHVRSPDGPGPLRRLWRNIRRHGPLFVPYRVWIAVRERARSPRGVPEVAGDGSVVVTELQVPRLHAPEVLEAVQRFGADLGVSCGAPILRRALFGLPRDGTINVHCGALPHFRGMPPGFWELATGATSVGASVHWMDDGLDTGRILDAATVPIDSDRDTIEDAEERALELGSQVLRQSLGRLAVAHSDGVPQAAGGRTFRAPLVRQRLVLGGRLLLRRWWRRTTSPRFLTRSFLTAIALVVWRPIRDLYRTLARRHPVRIFTFHRVTHLLRDGMTVTPARFTAQVDYIAQSHDIVPLASALAAIAQRRRLRRPLAVLTFDDGYNSVVSYAAPALGVRGCVATVYVSTAFPGTERRFEHDQDSPAREFLGTIDWETCASLIERGWSIGGHTRRHARASVCTPEGLRDEINGSFTDLFLRLPDASPTLAFPFGQPEDVSVGAIEEAHRAGYEVTFGDFGGENDPANAGRFLRRIDIGGDHDALAWRARAHAIEPGTALRLWRWRDRLRALDAAAGAFTAV